MTLFATAALVLVWVGYLIWNDISFWNKDIGTILFGSRSGEAISLGIGMTVINYVLIGVSLFTAGLVFFLRNRKLTVEQQQVIPIKHQRNIKKPKNKKIISKDEKKSLNKDENVAAREERFFSGCLHHFGYLSSRPKDSPIPQECILCQRLGDCMVATVYVQKVN
jgi:hypothetical protein